VSTSAPTSTVVRTVAAVPLADGATLHATVNGADDAPVTLVLAHGWTLAQAAWDDVAHALTPRVAAGDLRVVRYDQRGHGRSTWGDADITIDRLGADLGQLLDRLVPAGPVVLGGHSMGGMTIMALAAARPEIFGDCVRGVALVSTGAGDLTKDPRSAGGRIARVNPAVLNAALAGARVVERLRQLLPPTHPRHQKMVRGLLFGADATDEMVLAGAEIMHASTIRSFIEFMPALEGHDKRKELASLGRVPVEILVGDQDKLTPLRLSHEMAEALPDAVLHVAERTGHMLLQERPQLVTEAIGRLLTQATTERTAA